MPSSPAGEIVTTNLAEVAPALVKLRGVAIGRDAGVRS
jgi:hypothetical protein